MPTTVTTTTGSAPSPPAGRLTDNGLGAIFTIPAADWTTISQRVGIVHLLADIENEVARTIAGFPALLTACEAWRTATFPGLVAQAASLAGLCTQSIGAFTALQQSIAGLAPDAPLPPALQTQASEAIDALHDSSVLAARQVSALAAAVASFRDANDVADAQLAVYAQRLGPDWVSLVPSTTALGNATGLVDGSWSAITADLGELASGTIAITTELLLSLGIASALLSWTSLRDEAQAFASLADGQTAYLDGSWLAAGSRAR